MRLTQFWDKPTPPQEVQTLMSTWEAEKRFSYDRFDLDRARDYIRQHFGGDVVAAFDRCRPPAMKADLFRYCSLYAGGGVYIDADIGNSGTAFDFISDAIGGKTGFRRFLPIGLNGSKGVLMFRVTKKDGIVHHRLTNDVLIAHRKKLPLFGALVELSCENIRNEISQNVWVVTGPGVLNQLKKKENGDELFEDFNLVSIFKFKQHLKFVWQMDYKNGEDDWRPKDKDSGAPSIFVPAMNGPEAGV